MNRTAKMDSVLIGIITVLGTIVSFTARPNRGPQSPDRRNRGADIQTTALFDPRQILHQPPVFQNRANSSVAEGLSSLSNCLAKRPLVRSESEARCDADRPELPPIHAASLCSSTIRARARAFASG